ncbi:MAG: NAD(P)/FAD-dependent oxidoreductase [Clostridia bacterium]|nr:NAD(P)/FAD-dependent oxidoreductase [Clostridia bacterium]
MFDVLVIGCGVAGAGIAYELAHTKASVVVAEKENDVCYGASKANSAIVHAGYDPLPGTLMAKYNVWGSQLMPALCARLDVAYRPNGSLVVAFSNEGKPKLEALLARGEKNGVPGLRVIDGDSARVIEPNLSTQVAWALEVPGGAIIDPWELTVALAQTAALGGVDIRTDTQVLGIACAKDHYIARTNRGEIAARFVVNAAGAFADTVHNMVAQPTFSITTVRGEYLLLDKDQGALVARTIFQLPTDAGKGVLVLPTVHGNLLAGPTSEPVEGREDVSTSAIGMARVRELAAKSVPNINFRSVIRDFAGLRAANPSAHDFVIGFPPGHPRFLDVAAIQSPGLTSAPAIAVDVLRMLREAGLEAPEDPEFVDARQHVRFRELSAEEKNALIAKDPRYGRVICRCEGVTEGEIVEAIHRPVGPRSLDAVKRRCGAGLGRCQSGFCGPRVLDILAREWGTDPTQIPQDRAGSFLLTGRTKGGST